MRDTEAVAVRHRLQGKDTQDAAAPVRSSGFLCLLIYSCLCALVPCSFLLSDAFLFPLRHVILSRNCLSSSLLSFIRHL